MIIFIILVSIVRSSLCAVCGSSLIPFTFETLPTGGTVLGCARPTCFGWRPDGMPLPSATRFSLIRGSQNDGYERPSPEFIQTSDMSVLPQVAECEENFGSASCSEENQWVGGVIPNFNSAQTVNTLQCCSYEPLRNSSDRGVATVRAGEIVLGGEVIEFTQQMAFDYISNVEKSKDENGDTIYLVNIRRFECFKPLPPPMDPIAQIIPPQQPAPFIPQQMIPPPQQPAPFVPQQVIPPVQQPAPFVPQVAQYPIQSFSGFSFPTAQSYYCFTADMMVTLKDGSTRRMDELEVGDFVESIGEYGPEHSLVEFWIHRVPDQVAEFRRIELEDGSSLELTDYHYVYKTECSESKFVDMEDVKKVAVFAMEVDIGNCLYKYEDDGVKMVQVSNVTNISKTGIFAPMTETGKILVNNYHASCHTNIDNNVVQFSFFEQFMALNEKIGNIFGSYDQTDVLIGAGTIIEMMEIILPKSLFVF